MIADTYDPTDYVIKTQIYGESKPFFLHKGTPSTVQMHFAVSSSHELEFWGQLLTTNKFPLYKVQVELIEVRHRATLFEFKKLDETVTDLSGFYYFKHATSHIYCYYIKVVSSNVLYNHLLFSNMNRCYNKSCVDCPCYKQFQKGGVL